MIIYFFTKITLFCFIKKIKSIQDDDLVKTFEPFLGFDPVTGIDLKTRKLREQKPYGPSHEIGVGPATRSVIKYSCS